VSTIRVADYVAKRLVHLGVRHVFMVTGGGSMHLNDAFGRCKELEYVCFHHEQAAAIAAEGYVRCCKRPCAVNVTTGPGGLNTLTGVLGQWTDSVPVIYVSGQVKYETTIASCKQIPLRQLGDQEVSIIDVVSPLTKYAAMVIDPLDIKKAIDKAFAMATSERPGPVWIDIPINVQGAMIDEDDLHPIGPEHGIGNSSPMISSEVLASVVQELRSSKRPLIVAGHGIRISGSEDLFSDFIAALKIPVVTTFNGFDLLPDNHALYVGRIGTIGQRAGNFALQNADLIIFLGTRNNIRQVSYNWETVAHKANKIVIDIDPAELNKPTMRPDIAVHSDVKQFLLKCNTLLKTTTGMQWNDWLKWCKERSRRYGVVIPEYKTGKTINPYLFIHILTGLMDEYATAVCGNGSACVCMFQAGIVKKNQRIFWNSGCAAMGFDLPASIGACFAQQRKPVICIAGDGSFMMNLQELQTVKHHGLPIKIFLLNNGGYQSIKQTQDSFFGPPYIGCNKESGISFPDFTKVADVFGIKSEKIEKPAEMNDKIQRALAYSGPYLCEVMLSKDYMFSPKLSSKRHPDGTITSPSLEDMYPFLSPEELEQNQIDG
jgi:acetolactate synthase I/II/III large subunit